MLGVTLHVLVSGTSLGPIQQSLIHLRKIPHAATEDPDVPSQKPTPDYCCGNNPRLVLVLLSKLMREQEWHTTADGCVLLRSVPRADHPIGVSCRDWRED